MNKNDSLDDRADEGGEAPALHDSGEPGGAAAEAPGDAPDMMVVVGIGASAGGLSPLREFFDRIPAGSGLAFVVIQHISPHGQSLLPDLLRRHTEMQVRLAEEGMRARLSTAGTAG